MDWYFALGEETPLLAPYCDLVKVAVHTASVKTSLRPHFLYDGRENALTGWLRDREVPIIPHRSFLRAITSGRDMDIPMLAAVSGVFLRVDLPEIAPPAPSRVLYTDIDVIFLGDVVPELERTRAEYFAVAPEGDQQDYELMNTGVMLMNVAKLRQSLPTFRAYIEEHLDELHLESWDEGAYRQFYRDENRKRQWDDLPPAMNWKPYWGENAAAKLIHFHGPKPFQQPHIDSHWPELKFLTGGSYPAMCDLWHSLLEEANR